MIVETWAMLCVSDHCLLEDNHVLLIRAAIHGTLCEILSGRVSVVATSLYFHRGWSVAGTTPHGLHLEGGGFELDKAVMMQMQALYPSEQAWWEENLLQVLQVTGVVVGAGLTVPVAC
jgi:hypothetical protein